MRTGDFTRYARQLLAPLSTSGEARCPRCGCTIWPGQEWDVGHAIDLVKDPHQSHTRAGVRAAIRDGMLRPEHRSCNRSAGAALGNRLRKRNPARPKPKPRPARPLPPPSRSW
jgi:hypothetical protein